jgi:ferrous iron transport protein A
MASKFGGAVVLDPHRPLLNNTVMTDLTSPTDMLLGHAARGFVGIIQALKTGPDGSASDDLERQLIEMGFTEGARVEILHEGAIARDPIAVRIDNVTMALRRREALAVVVR